MEEYVIVSCVDKGLEPYGSQVKQTVYWRLSMHHGSLHNSLIADPSIFVNVLREIVGAGSKAIERSIVSELKQVFSLPKTEGRSQDLLSVLIAAREQITGCEVGSPMPTSSLGTSNRQQWGW